MQTQITMPTTIGEAKSSPPAALQILRGTIACTALYVCYVAISLTGSHTMDNIAKATGIRSQLLDKIIVIVAIPFIFTTFIILQSRFWDAYKTISLKEYNHLLDQGYTSIRIANNQITLIAPKNYTINEASEFWKLEQSIINNRTKSITFQVTHELLKYLNAENIIIESSTRFV